jgi:hypothetical protein
LPKQPISACVPEREAGIRETPVEIRITEVSNMRKTPTSMAVVLSISLFGCAGPLAAPPSRDVTVVNREIVPVQICEVFANPTDVYLVPDDSILVIEDATVTVTGVPNLDDGDIVIGLITTTVNDVTGTHAIARIEGDISSLDYAGRTMTVYADPGTTVQFGRLFQSGGPGAGLPNVKICASGRLEAIP